MYRLSTWSSSLLRASHVFMRCFAPFGPAYASAGAAGLLDVRQPEGYHEFTHELFGRLAAWVQAAVGGPAPSL